MRRIDDVAHAELSSRDQTENSNAGRIGKAFEQRVEIVHFQRLARRGLLHESHSSATVAPAYGYIERSWLPRRHDFAGNELWVSAVEDVPHANGSFESPEGPCRA